MPKPRHELKLSQHRSLLRLMPMHAAENVVENVNRLHDVRSLVEHDALRAVRHRRIGNLRPRGLAVLGQALEHLRRPDDWDMRGLADPQDLLLHFGESLEPTLDCEIAPRNHHTASRRLHRFEQHRRKIFEATLGLYLEDDCGLPIAKWRQERSECANIVNGVCE